MKLSGVVLAVIGLAALLAALALDDLSEICGLAAGGAVLCLGGAAMIIKKQEETLFTRKEG